MRRDWETRLAGEPEYNSRMKKHAEISKEAIPEVKKEEPIPEKLKEEHISQELPRALTSPNQMKQTREVCQMRSH
jgi:hypothetical protein